jgi:hypothetical protein
VGVSEQLAEAFTEAANDILLERVNGDHPGLVHINQTHGVTLVKNAAERPSPEAVLIRPIKVNEAFLNVVCNIALERVSPLVLPRLHRYDFGIGRPGGVEAIVQATRATFAMSRLQGRSCLAIATDYRNAIMRCHGSSSSELWRRCVRCSSPWTASAIAT